MNISLRVNPESVYILKLMLRKEIKFDILYTL